MLDQSLYNLTQQFQGRLVQRAFTAYQEQSDETTPTPSPLFQLRQGYAESPGWVMVQVLEFDPEPLTVDVFRQRAVYSAPGIVAAMLELLASEKLLHRQNNSAYRLADAGRDYLENRRQFVQQVLAYSPDASEIEPIAKILAKIIEASLQSGQGDAVWCLAHSRRRAPATNRPSIEQILQYMQDFNAFRDDAHMAAYRMCEVSGEVWEAFAFVVGDKANDAVSLFDQLAYRGFSVLEWQQALEDLVKRGWLQRTIDKTYSVTVAGLQQYQQVERKTDEIFFAPWQAIDDAEHRTLVTTMQTIIAE